MKKALKGTQRNDKIYFTEIMVKDVNNKISKLNDIIITVR